MSFSQEWNEFLNLLKSYQDFHYPYALWYRGQGCDKPLNSGLFRFDFNNLYEYKSFERNAYRMFLNHGHPFLTGEKDWELLFVMQHHGVRTRLLDWTPSLLNALYFATVKVENPVLWILEPRKLNKITYDHLGLFSLPLTSTYESFIDENTDKLFSTIALLPTKNTSRQIIQQGVFTVQGDDSEPLEFEHRGRYVKESILVKIELTPTLIKDIKIFLEMNSIDNFRLFPDLDGLSKYINEKYSPR